MRLNEGTFDGWLPLLKLKFLTPVNTLSGMYLPLAEPLCASGPEILLVDEVLAVGDMRFKRSVWKDGKSYVSWQNGSVCKPQPWRSKIVPELYRSVGR
jgi:hypothetical protein